jgi:hypothetical protein
MSLNHPRRTLPMLAAGLAALRFVKARAAPSLRPSIGAIRWDAWYSDRQTGVRAAVEETLGPKEFQGRAPDFAKPTSDHTISIDGDLQAQVDREITLASAAGIGFWAYCFYDMETQLMNAWALHQSSKLRDHIQWCMILPSSTLLKKLTDGDILTYITFMKQENYKRVLGQRPLLFLLDDNTSIPMVEPALAALRHGCSTANVANPYVAIMSWQPAATRDKLKQAGADAISAYSIGHPNATASFDDLDKAVRSQWEAMRQTGVPCIPLAVTGEDRRPRIDHPVPWEADRQKAGAGRKQFFKAGTPTQIAAQVRAMADWIAAQPDACPSQCGIIYSWDECDEGGSTLLPSLSGGDAILRAVGRALR